MSRLFTVFVIVLSFALVAPAATVLSDNTMYVSGGGDYVSGSQWPFEAFQTDNHFYSLVSVTLPLFYFPEFGVCCGTPVVDIYNTSGTPWSDGGPQPGTLLASLGAGSVPGYTFTASGITLDPLTTYWVFLRGVDGPLYWSFTQNTGGTGVGWSGRNGVTYNAGATWNQVLGPQFGYVPQMQVLADPIIPEPASLFLVFPAGIALLLGRKLHRS